MNEIWRVIPETTELYKASNLGNIRRVEGTVDFGKSKRKVGGKNLKPKTKSNGYLEVNLSINKKGKSRYVHRLVVAAFLGTIDTGLQVNHKDGVKSNNNLDNLEIVTGSQNMKHSYLYLGSKPPNIKGSHHGNTNLTDEDVIYIRSNYVKGKSNSQLYEKFKDKVGISCFRKICYGVSWKHLL